ncbi:MAG: Ni/Fe hydrogenase subunit alpha [Candidatus Heimdallarchaeaceae archaeon]
MTEKAVTVDVLARVEGDGGIQVYTKNNKVEKVLVNIFEGPRMIEALVRGKTIDENISLVARICAICTVSHRYASIKAIEKALKVEVPKKVELLRHLLHYAEYIESHVLHVYYLALPDFFKQPSAIALLPTHTETVLEAVELKKYGTELMKLLHGRKIHGENAQIGGFGRIPTDEELDYFAEKAIEYKEKISKFIDVFGTLEIPDYCERETIFMCCNPGNGKFGFEGETILLSTGEEYPVEEYKKLTNERVVPHSYAKRSSYKGKPFTVGALARLLLIGDRLTGEAKEKFEKYYTDKWKVNPLYNNMAQLIETLWCFEQIPELIKEIKNLPDAEIVEVKTKKGKATAAVEAPRGILYHTYEIEGGKMTNADIITPTAQFLDDVEAFIWTAAEKLLKENHPDTELQLEMIARAYDPCISCSCHLVRLVKQ